MENIAKTFQDYYAPFKGFVAYRNETKGDKYYVESFEFSTNGKPINFHVLTQNEATKLAETLYPNTDLSGFLHIKSLLPISVLHINNSFNGSVVWYTEKRKVNLIFKDELGIPSGMAFVPPLVWKASKTSLSLYSLKKEDRPTLETSLYAAPFLNINQSGEVCMGDVKKDFKDNCDVETFMRKWEHYFFDSKFSHLLGGNPVKGNVAKIWTDQVNKSRQFPVDCLIKTKLTLKSIIHGYR